MFCGKCGKEIAEGKKFCPYCGFSLEGIVPEVKKNPVKAKPILKEEKKGGFRINIALVITLVEVLVLSALIWGFFRVGQIVYGPEALANEYMKALAEDNWAVIMNLTDVEESEFLSGASFKKAISELVPEDFDSFNISLRKMRGDTAEVQVKYGSDGKNRNSLKLIMEKQDDKKLLLFDTWKVSADNFVLEDFVIYSPKGTDAYFDGKQLNDNLIREGYVPNVENSDNFTRYAEEFDSYVIPEIYVGTHECAALVGDNTVSALKFEASEENKYVAMTEISSTEQLQEKIISEANSDLKTILEAKVNGKAFDDISDIYLGSSDTLDRMRRNYENSLDKYYSTDSETGIKQIEVRDIKGRLQDFYLGNEGELTSQVNLEFEYDTTIIAKDWWSGKLGESMRENNSGNFYVHLVYSDDAWKIKEQQLPYGL